MPTYVNTPIVVQARGTTEGAVADGPGGLAGAELLGVSGAACTVWVSPDGSAWTPVTFPHVLAVGFLRFTRSLTATQWSVVRARTPVGENAAPPTEVWTFEDDFARTALGANYTATLNGATTRGTPISVDGASVVNAFPAFTGNSTPDQVYTELGLTATSWNSAAAQVQADLTFSADLYPAASFGRTFLNLVLAGQSDSVILGIGGDGAVELLASGASILASTTVPAISGLWNLTVDEVAGKIDVTRNGAVILSAPFPVGFVASMAGQGRVSVEAGRTLASNGNFTYPATSISVNALRVRSGNNRATP